jgi:hypothetical protein
LSRVILCHSVTDPITGAVTKIQQVDADHPLPVAATVSATASTVAKATAAAPTYVEGDVAAPLSVDLAGGLRITGTINASSSMRSTTADPSYTNGTDNSLSSDLAGYLRVLAKFASGQTVGLVAGSAIVGKVGIDQTTPGTTNAVAATNLPTAVDVNSGSKSNSTLRVVLATDQPALTAALKVDGSAVTQPVSGTFWQATQPVSIATAPVLVAGSAIIGKVGIDQTTPGTTNLVAAGQNGTWNIGTVTTLTGVTPAFGATGASVPASAAYMGGRTLAATPSDTTAQMNAPVLDLKGSLAVQPYGLGDNVISGLTAAMTGTTSTAVTGIGAPGVNLFNYITTIVVGNSHATVGTFVELQDGSGGTTFFTVPAAAVYGGAVITLPKPLKQPTANTALFCKNTTTGANVIVSVAGFKGP